MKTTTQYKIVDIPIQSVPGKKTDPLHEKLLHQMLETPVGESVRVKVPSWVKRISIYQFFTRSQRAKELKCTVLQRGDYVLITRT